MAGQDHRLDIRLGGSSRSSQRPALAQLYCCHACVCVYVCSAQTVDMFFLIKEATGLQNKPTDEGARPSMKHMVSVMDGGGGVHGNTCF